MLVIRRPTEHHESVYNLIERAKPPPPKPPREEAEKKKLGEHKTMGYAVVPLDPPKLYLRKHTRSAISLHPRPVSKAELYQLGVQVRLKEHKKAGEEVNGEPERAAGEEVGIREQAPKSADWLSDAPHRRRHCPHEAKPPVPATCCSRFVRIERGEKDFVMDNTISALREPPKIPYPRYVDSPRGTARDWCRSGLARKYVMKSDFGTVPEYLSTRKQELQAKEEAERQKEEEERRRALERCRPLTDEERHKLKAGLERHWNEVYNEFQSFPLVVDRPLAIKSKAELERKLKEIEKDIQFLKDHKYIFASDSKKTFYLH